MKFSFTKICSKLWFILGDTCTSWSEVEKTNLIFLNVALNRRTLRAMLKSQPKGDTGK